MSVEGSELQVIWQRSQDNEQQRDAVEYLMGLRAQAIASLPATIHSLHRELGEKQSESRYQVDRYASRTFSVSDGERLIAVTAYKKGAKEVRRQLEARDQQIIELRNLLTSVVSYLLRKEDHPQLFTHADHDAN
jgi:hypothetical protein